MSLHAAHAQLAELDALTGVLLGKARKRPSIYDDEGFIQALLREATAIRGEVTKALATSSVRAKLKRSTEVDWRRLNDARREEVLDELANLLAGLPSQFAPGVVTILDRETRRVVKEGHEQLGRTYDRFKVDPSFLLKNKRAIEAIRDTTAIAFAPAYERQATHFRPRAQRAMERGLRRGFGPREIGDDLRREFRETAIHSAYWDTVAATHVARARSFSAAATYAENGVTYYEVVNPMDERTTPVCAMMHGTILPVETVLGQFDAMEAKVKSVDDLKELVPFMRVEDKKIVTQRGDVVARIGRDGEFKGKLSEEKLGSAGVGMPPYHYRCRSTVIAVL